MGELVHLDIKQLGRFWQVGKRVHKDGIQRSRRAGRTYAHVVTLGGDAELAAEGGAGGPGGAQWRVAERVFDRPQQGRSA